MALLLFGGALALCTALVGNAPRPLVLGVALMAGTLGPLVTGGMTGLLRDLSRPERIDDAYRLDIVTYNVAGICGPALAAAIAGVTTAEVAALTLAAFAGIAAVAMLSLPLHATTTDDRVAAERLLHSFSRGIAVFLRRPLLRAATTASCLAQLGAGAMPVAIALIADRYYSESVVGLLLVVSAIGGLAGSLAYARWPIGATRPAVALLASYLFTALPVAGLLVLADNKGAAIVLAALIGLGGVPQGTALFLIRDREAPAEVRAQVFTTGAGLKITASALGAAVAGVISGAGTTVVIAVIVACYLVGAVIGAFTMPPGALRGSAD